MCIISSDPEGTCLLAQEGFFWVDFLVFLFKKVIILSPNRANSLHF